MKPSNPSPTVSVTIVNHRARDLLRECLASLRRHPYTGGRMEVIVLDNASHDGSVEMVGTEFPEVSVIAQNVRRGFGANQNRAIASSAGDVVFVLNPDAVVHQHTIDRLVDALWGRAGVGVAAGPIANTDGSWRQHEPYVFPTPLSPFAKAFGIRRSNASHPRPAGVVDDGWPSGGAFVVLRTAFDDAGGFDEGFFMYSEDTDLFRRLIDTGHLVAWVPDAVVTHPPADETAELSRRREAESMRAELRYIAKHFGRPGSWVFRVGTAVDAASRTLVFSIPVLARRARTHGMTVAYNRRLHAARLAASLTAPWRRGLAEAAEEWNLRQVDGDSAAAGASEPAPPLIVFDSSTTWDDPWLASQHIAIHLSARATVLFVDLPQSPVSSFRRERRIVLRTRLSQVGEGLYRLTPAAPPGMTRWGIHRLTALSVRWAVRRAIRSFDRPVEAVVARLAVTNLFGVVAARTRLYYVSDDFAAGAGLMGRPADRIRALDAELARDADVIVAASEIIAEHYRSRGHQPVLIPNGVEVAAFADVDGVPLPPDVLLPAPVAGYVGQIGDRIDLALLEAVAGTGVSLLLVGPRQRTFSDDPRLERILGRRNVQWVGEKTFAELPRYLRAIDVGLVPYTQSEFNRASFPLKTLEYLAAGRAVVATPLPAVVWLDTDEITLAQTPADFADAVSRAAATPRSKDVLDRRRRLASRHSWSHRVDQLAEVLDLDRETRHRALTAGPNESAEADD